MKTKLITIKKRGGGTRKQLVQVLQSGKFKFLKMGSKAKSLGSKIKSKAKSKGSRKNPGNTNKKPGGSTRSVTKQTTVSRLYPKKSAKDIALKAVIGTIAGTLVRVGTMFFPQPVVREFGSRGANAVSSYFGGGTGNVGYQAVDATLSRVILLNNGGGNGNGGVTVPNPLGGGA